MALGWSQETLADRARVWRGQVAKYEAGASGWNAKTLGRLVDTFRREGVHFIEGGLRFTKSG